MTSLAGLLALQERLISVELETKTGGGWFETWLELLLMQEQPLPKELGDISRRVDRIVQATLAIETSTAEKRTLESEAASHSVEEPPQKKAPSESTIPTNSFTAGEQKSTESADAKPAELVEPRPTEPTDARPAESIDAASPASIPTPVESATPAQEPAPTPSKLASFLATAEKRPSPQESQIQNPSSPGHSIRPSSPSSPVKAPSSPAAKSVSSPPATGKTPSTPSAAAKAPSSPSATGKASAGPSAAAKAPSSPSAAAKAPSSPSAAGNAPSSPLTAAKAPASPSVAGKTPSSPLTTEKAPAGPSALRAPSSPSPVAPSIPVTSEQAPSNPTEVPASPTTTKAPESQQSESPVSAPKQTEGGHMVVSDACFDLFQEIKIRKKHRFLLFKIHDWELQLTKIGERSLGLDDFLKELPFSECRFAVYDHEKMKSDQYGSRMAAKVYFITWQPVPAPTQFKMLYSTERKTLSAVFKGVEEIVATKRDDILFAVGAKDKFAAEESDDEERGGKGDWMDD